MLLFSKMQSTLRYVIIGKRINRAAGYGLELPCKFKFQGDQTFLCDWVEEKFKKEKFEELR